MNPEEPRAQIERVLAEMREGDESARERLLPLVYDELKVLANACFRGQPGSHTLQPTALVHDAFAKLVNTSEAQWKDRAHFLAVAATAMRQILVSHARKRGAEKRGGDRGRVTLEKVLSSMASEGLDFVLFEELLSRLARVGARPARVVELRVFGGLSVEETAHVLEVGVTTVKEDWQFARAWLAREMDRV